MDKEVRLTRHLPPPDSELGWPLASDTLRLVYEVTVTTNKPVLVVDFAEELREMGWQVIRGSEPVTIREGVDWAFEHVEGMPHPTKRQDIQFSLEYLVTPERYVLGDIGLSSLYLPHGPRYRFVESEANRAYRRRQQAECLEMQRAAPDSVKVLCADEAIPVTADIPVGRRVQPTVPPTPPIE